MRSDGTGNLDGTGTAGEQPLATVQQADGHLGLRYERRLAHPPEKVWRALTESEHLEHWMPCDIVGERRAGASIDLPFWPGHVERYAIEEPVLHGQIRVWEPPRVFEWTWGTDVLRWELEETAAGTLLTFTTWLGDDDATKAANTGAGYHVCLSFLETWLDTGATGPVVDAEVAFWEARYTEAIAGRSD